MRYLQAPSVKFIVILELRSTISMWISLSLNLSMYHPNLELAIGLWNAYLSQKLVFHSVYFAGLSEPGGRRGMRKFFCQYQLTLSQPEEGQIMPTSL